MLIVICLNVTNISVFILYSLNNSCKKALIQLSYSVDHILGSL